MPPLVPEEVTEFAETVGPDSDDVLREMQRHAESEDFPIVGPAVGGWLAFFVRMVDASRVFEFGSGFGYSAYWFALALESEDEVVLTEVDGQELDLAEEFFEEGGVADRAVFEAGDAIEIIESYEGPFDVALIDNEKSRYIDAFEAVREKVAPSGVVLADNAMRADPVVDFEDLREIVAGGDPGGASEGTRGIAAYLEAVRADSEFETAILPLGSGVAVSYRTERVRTGWVPGPNSSIAAWMSSASAFWR
jgi:predicted O-methyltransferase YrrM